MIKVYKDSIIYVTCPYGDVSGGPETLHQLAFELRKNGYKAYMYYHLSNKNKKIEIPDKFKLYNLDYVQEIIDNEKNVIVIPEAYTELLYKYKKIRKCMWFLSLDFYLKFLNKNRIKIMLEYRNIPKILHMFFWPFLYLYLGICKKSFNELHFDRDKNINSYYYLYNCQYVKDFLIKNGVNDENTCYLCGPIRNDYIETTIEDAKKEDILVYNPAKGYEFTQKILKELSKVRENLKVIPIKNMTPAQIKVLLRKAKLYIDFGFFPGPERIPREAVCCYCNIITSTSGSAGNNVDVLVPKQYKFDISNSNIEKIVDKINLLIDKYEENVPEFDDYRKKVKEQPYLFKSNILKVFNKA